MTGARFEMYQDPGDGWRWRLRDADGATIADGAHSFDSTEQCRREIQSVRQNAFEAPLEEPEKPAPSRRGRRKPPSEKGKGDREPPGAKNPFNAAA